MSRWTDRLEQHDFTSKLRKLTESLEGLSLPEGSDVNVAIELGRFKKVITYLDAVISAADYELLSPVIFDEMQAQLEHVTSHFYNFCDYGNLETIQRTNDFVDNLLNIVSRAFVFYSKPTKADLNSIVKSYVNAINAHTDNLKNTSEQAIENFSGKIQSEERRLADLILKIEKVKTELEAVQTKTRSQIENFSTDHKEQIAKQQAGFQEWLFEKSNQIDDEFTRIEVKSEKIIENLNSLKGDAEEVFGVVQNTAQAGAHKQYADEQKTSANRYRLLAIALMLTAVSVLIVPELISLFSGADFAIEWINLLSRSPISIAFFATAFYLARESEKHRKNEFQNRRKELTLRTIDPYLQLLADKQKQDEIKAQGAQNIFGNAPTESPEETSNILAQLTNLVKQFGKTGQ